MRRPAVALGLALLAVTGDAAADQGMCVKTAERGQVLRADSKLREAHKAFVTCSADCPAVIAKDCAAWAEQVLAAMPSIVVDAKDDAGHDVGDATLTLDGEVVAKQLDGKAIPVNPGSHTLVVQRNAAAGSSKRTPSVTETIIAKEGAKARSIRVVLPRDDAAVPAAPASDVKEPDGGAHSVVPWIVVGVGAAVVVTGLVVVLTSPETPRGCNRATETCTPLPSETTSSPSFIERQTEAGQAQTMPLYGWLTVGAGAAVIAGGLLWHFLETPKPRNAMIAPWLQAGSGGLVARGSF